MDYRSYTDLCSVARLYADIRSVCFMDYSCLRSFQRRFSCCAVQTLMVFSLLLFPAFADEPSADLPVEETGEEQEAPVTEVINATEVYILPDDIDVSRFLEAGADAFEVYEVLSDPKLPQASGDDFPFYGSGWAVGSASGLGDAQLFFPINRRDFIGVDSDGCLFNVSDQSFSGVMYVDGSAYTVSFGSFSYPRYRYESSSSWEYEMLYFTPVESNLVLDDSPAPAYSLSDLLPWVSLLLLGGVLLCCMRKS